MNKEEMICKNCKYHYIEDISFDYPQSCCSKRQCTTEQWCKCYDFEYSDRYVEQLQQENKHLKDNWNELKKFIGECLEAINTIQKLTGNAIENYTPRILTYNQIKDKMQELEKGSDNK